MTKDTAVKLFFIVVMTGLLFALPMMLGCAPETLPRLSEAETNSIAKTGSRNLEP